MPSRSSRKLNSVSTQGAELAIAVPQVVAHRLARMAMAGPSPSARDRKEFERMVTEKGTAFAQAWFAMTRQSVLAAQTISTCYWRSLWWPSLSGPQRIGLAEQVQRAALDILGKGLAPVHRKAVSNAKRLGRTKLR